MFFQRVDAFYLSLLCRSGLLFLFPRSSPSRPLDLYCSYSVINREAFRFALNQPTGCERGRHFHIRGHVLWQRTEERWIGFVVDRSISLKVVG